MVSDAVPVFATDTPAPDPSTRRRRRQLAPPGSPDEVVLTGLRPGSSPSADDGPWSLLASAVSEDLRASLALVGGYSQTLLHLTLDEPARERHVAGLLAATGAVAQAAGEVLDLVLATAGRPGLHRRPVTAEWLVDHVGRMGSGIADSGLECHADPGLPLVEVDPTWLIHAMRILVVHAQRHPAATARSVTVHAHGNPSSVVIAVRAAARTTPAVPRLPRPLPARDAEADSHLALCRRIVEANGGMLRLDETQDRCFATISLPSLRTKAADGARSPDAM
jgi:K+-sensing histidine kinase KdpD